MLVWKERWSQMVPRAAQETWRSEAEWRQDVVVTGSRLYTDLLERLDVLVAREFGKLEEAVLAGTPYRAGASLKVLLRIRLAMMTILKDEAETFVPTLKSRQQTDLFPDPDAKSYPGAV